MWLEMTMASWDWWLWLLPLLPVLGTVTAAWADPTAAIGSGGIDLADGDIPTEAQWDRFPSNLLRLGGTDGFGHISGVGFKNVSVAASVSGNALTVTIQGALATMSTTNRALFRFRNATLNTPALTSVESSADLTITVPDTGTLGTSNGVAARIYVGVTNDGGTLRVVLFNTQGSGVLYPLPSEAALHSATAIGTGSDSAGVLYCSAATSSKALIWVGYIEITEATAGTWATDATVEQTFGPGVPRSGQVVQSVFASYSTETGNSTSTPADTGLTATITPTNAINRVKVSVNQNGGWKSGADSNNALNCKLVGGGSDLAQFAFRVLQTGAAEVVYGAVGALVYWDAPATASARIYKTQFWNQNNAAEVRVQVGSSATSTILLEEIFA